MFHPFVEHELAIVNQRNIIEISRYPIRTKKRQAAMEILRKQASGLLFYSRLPASWLVSGETRESELAKLKWDGRVLQFCGSTQRGLLFEKQSDHTKFQSLFGE